MGFSNSSVAADVSWAESGNDKMMIDDEEKERGRRTERARGCGVR